jgi:hypothetical protein
MIEFSINISHPNLSVSAASDFFNSNSGWVLRLPASTKKVLVHGRGHDTSSEDDFVIRSNGPNVSGSTDSDAGTLLGSGFSDPSATGDRIFGNSSSDNWFSARGTSPNNTVTTDIAISHSFSSVWNVDPELWMLWRCDWLIRMFFMVPKVVLNINTPSDKVLRSSDVYMVGDNENQSWTQIEGSLVQLDVGTERVVGVNNWGEIFFRSSSASTPSKWIQINGHLKQVTTSQNFVTWGVDV